MEKVTVAKRNTEDLLRDIDKLLRTQEELDPALAMYIDEDGPLGPSVKHPLVFSIIHTPTMNAYINAQFRAKKQAVEEALAEKKWAKYIWLHERPYRVDAFRGISAQLDGPQYWELLGEVYIDSENVWQNRDEWLALLQVNLPGREMMTDEKDRAVFTLAPEAGGLLDETVVYRGYRHEDGLDGFSWTLNKATAKWFARRFPHQGGIATVATGKVARDNVIAYLTGRGELEILALDVDIISIEEGEDV